tara:strand:- start:10721 stop:12994 length:2274 start_codon:yes stop_codon:yes gene_type:complete
MSKKNNEIFAILLASLSFFIFLSLISFKSDYEPSIIKDLLFSDSTYNNNLPFTGILGASISSILVKYCLGYGSFFICSILFMYSYLLFTRKDYSSKKYVFLSLYQLGCGLWVSIFLTWYFGVSDTAGLFGYLAHNFLHESIRDFIYILLPITFLILLRGFIEFSIYDITFKGVEKFKNLISKFKSEQIEINQSSTINTTLSSEPVKSNDVPPDLKNNSDEPLNNEIDDQDIISEDSDIEEKLDEDIENDHDIIIDDEESIDTGDIDQINSQAYDNYKLPSSNLLNNPIEITNSLTEDDLKTQASQLIHALETFNVKGQVIRISPGPVITLFEIEPAEGVRVNKFTTLSDDLARVMQAKSIRVIAPIPGSSSVGIELPNANPQTVFLKSILNSEKYLNSESKLTIAVGKTTTGDAFVFDLGKLPHLLIAGATGAGKSVCINTIIMSILYKAKPDEVKFVLIDPKKLELSIYKQLVGYHLTTSPNLDEYVMTTADNAVGILDASIHEMERRFSLFAEASVRNISEYHSKYANDKTMENVPYLVVLIDELADLMMTSSRAIEDPITRLAQKARAVGIHLVVATQRPSVDVITGLIKSNFPARLSFQVSSKVDSRTILDQMGAEKLLGKGDLLFLQPGTGSPIRLHNAFINLDEIQEVLTHINTQPKPSELKLPEAKKVTIEGKANLEDNHDELLEEAAKLIVDTGQASVSLLQRRFRIGYSRAGRLIDELESLGIISGYSGSKARDILVDEAYINNIFNK